MFSGGWGHIIACVDGLIGYAFLPIAHGVGRRGGEEHLELTNRSFGARQKLRGQNAAVL